MTLSSSGSACRGKIVCVGDLLVDVQWRVDTAARNVEHAAVALTSNRSHQISAGGAGLFAVNAARAGFDVTLFSVADTAHLTSRMLVKLAKTVDVSHVQVIEDFHTPVKTRYINENGHILVRHDSETTDQPLHNNPPLGQLVSSSDAVSCVVVSDYNKQCISDCRADIVHAAHAMSVPVFVDAKPAQLKDYAGADLFKLNRAELDGLVGSHLDFAAALRAAAVVLATPLLIVTDGAKGVGWCLRGQPGFLASPKKYRAGNCVGAGDTFFAGLLLGFSEVGQFGCRTMAAEQLLTALKFALVAAGQRVRSNGAKLLDAKKILREVNKAKTSAPALKIMSCEMLASMAATMKDRGLRVVFTNGCFDLLHAGHMHLLAFAKTFGDIVIVGVDSDESVRALKGPARPIQNAQTRANNLAALVDVDAVCIFGDTGPSTPTLADIIAAVMPDVLVKGADYAAKVIVGAKEVLQNNGQIALCPLLPNISTTALVERIRATANDAR